MVDHAHGGAEEGPVVGLADALDDAALGADEVDELGPLGGRGALLARGMLHGPRTEPRSVARWCQRGSLVMHAPACPT